MCDSATSSPIEPSSIARRDGAWLGLGVGLAFDGTAALTARRGPTGGDRTVRAPRAARVAAVTAAPTAACTISAMCCGWGPLACLHGASSAAAEAAQPVPLLSHAMHPLLSPSTLRRSEVRVEKREPQPGEAAPLLARGRQRGGAARGGACSRRNG